jgi:hypothetical protein
MRKNIIRANGLNAVVCGTCKELKLIDELRAEKGGGKPYYRHMCKECYRKIRLKYYHQNKDKINKRVRKRRRENKEHYLWQSAKHRAGSDNIPFNIEESDIIIPEYCPVLGIKLEKGNGKGPSDNSPSLDRIIPERGYVKGNIVVTSWRANSLKSDSTLEEMKKIVSFYEKLLTFNAD